ncbi:MAG: TatD family hydrolase [Dehalococcoidia bacterium]|nr:TatD family hydrolase [Dehalococcoidia bacterium]
MGPPRWFDTHAHLERYEPGELGPLLDRAAAAGVERVLAVSTGIVSSRRTVRLPPAVLRAVGAHPLQAAEGTGGLERLATAPGVVAIGEAGFDAQGPALVVQEAVFRSQCGLAADRRLAVVLHVDAAWEPFLAAADALAAVPVVVRHYFTADAVQAAWHAERGHYLSFGRPLLRDPALAAVARDYPAGLLLVETDAYPLPGRTTEPADVVAVGERLGALRGWAPDEAAARLWENSGRAFGLPV